MIDISGMAGIVVYSTCTPGAAAQLQPRPIFASYDLALNYCQAVPKMSERIVKIVGPTWTKWLVMTGLCGYANHFESVISAPNAKLITVPENDLGDHLVYLEARGSCELGGVSPELSPVAESLRNLTQSAVAGRGRVHRV